jgi:hypothetical protein
VSRSHDCLVVGIAVRLATPLLETAGRGTLAT